MAPRGAEHPSHAGEIRTPGREAVPGTVTLDDDAVILAPDGGPPRMIAYRDLAVVGIADLAGLVATGDGPDAERWLLERFGAAIGPLVGALRERRLRQRLADALVVLPAEEPVELVEYAASGTATGAAAGAGAGPGATGAGHGIAQLAVDGWGVTLAPLDERLPVVRVRRAEIGAVDFVPQVGGVRVAGPGGGFELLRLGAGATRHRDRLAGLPRTARLDAAAILGRLVPDLPPASLGRATEALLDGRPASSADLGESWQPLERSVLAEPTFEVSYLALRERAGGREALRWLALAPERPGDPATHRAWFLVALPGNLVALELVSEGAHATYCFRAGPRASFTGGADPAGIDAAAAGRAVAQISAALVDARFLREPISTPDERLAAPDGIRYRLALRAIPSLAAARRDFVGRLVHRDQASWSAALDDLIAWHAACRDDAAAWPGRPVQEAQVAEAADGGGAAG
jgi:hypothetical protein